MPNNNRKANSLGCSQPFAGLLYKWFSMIYKLKDMFMLRQKISIIFTALCICFCSSGAFAKTRMVEVKLLDIEAKGLTERTGDELYFTITEYPSKGHPKILRVPMFPLHWLSRDLNNVNNVLLWKGPITDESSVLLILSLLEQDLPLIGIDDHLGSVQVKIANTNNKIITAWGQPNFVDQPKVEQTRTNTPDYLLFGGNGEYAVKFKINVIE